MSNEILEKLLNFSIAIALIFGMIIKGKIGVIGFTIFFIITSIVGWIYQKRTEPQRRVALIEKVFIIGLYVLLFPLVYLGEFKPSSKMVDIFMILFPIWTFGGLIILSIRARKKRKGY